MIFFNTFQNRKENFLKVYYIIVAYAFFSEITVVQPLMNMGIHVVSKLKDDANLRYKLTGGYVGKGRSPLLAGKVNINNLNMNVFTKIQVDENTVAFYAIVNSNSLKTDILLVVQRKIDENGKTIQCLIFSTDTKMNLLEVL